MDNPIRHHAFRKFLVDNQPKLNELINAIGITPNELLDSIKGLMQGYIYTWTEEQVIEKLKELIVEYQLINTLNIAMSVKRKSLKQIRDDLNNCFNNMKVPGTVIETLEEEWIPSLKTMRLISEDSWNKLNIAEKEQFILTLTDGHAKQAWDNITVPRMLLTKYLNKREIFCTEPEIYSIYFGLKPMPYNTPIPSFEVTLQNFIDGISYERNKQKLLKLWQEQSGEETVSDWCKHYNIPIHWVVSDLALAYVHVIKLINDGNKVEAIQLKKAVEFFEQNNLTILRNTDEIQEHFYLQIGKENVSRFKEHQDEILARIRMKFGADVYSWGNKAGEIRNIVETYIRDKIADTYKSKARIWVMEMPDIELRDRVLKLLDDHPEYCELFIYQE
jgi:hypothetical protein